MALNRNDVEHVARLARLALTDGEKDSLTHELDKILGFVEKLKELDTENVPVTAHPFASKTVWREDQARLSGASDAILELAPEREDRFFKVKKVIE